MSTRVPGAKIVALALALSALDARAVRAQGGESILPLELTVNSAPQLARAGGRWYLVYELHLTNFYSAPVTIGEVSVGSSDKSARILRRYSGDELERNLKTIGPRPDTASTRRLLPGRRSVLFIWAPLASPAQRPAVVDHRVAATIEAAKDSQIVLGARTRVSARRPVVIDPPLRGAGWISFYGACPDAVPEHDRLAYPRGGLVRFPQRFAVDWVRSGTDGRVFHGDSSRNENYYAYRQPVYAVGDGIVLSTIADVEENTPPEITVRMTRHTVAGNIILLDIGDGAYAVYGHLRPGSLRVSPGDRVRRGQIIAEVGNTGNSTGPHLHFHILDGPSTGAGEGLAFMYRSYGLISAEPVPEEILDEGKVWKPAPWAAMPRTRDLPTCGSLVTLS
ncbi:MAG TPA: M23 family metallopeptidase [Gemmatimonadaceae bacterium]|nr:M23 family metallopeptidase [Gemmatimonadaceae bacterium]